MVVNSCRDNDTDTSTMSSSEECKAIILLKDGTMKDVEDVLPEDIEKQGIQHSTWIRNNSSVTQITIIFIMMILSFSLGYVSNSCDIFDEEKEVLLVSNDQKMNVIIQEEGTADPLNSSVHDSDNGIIVTTTVQQEVIDEQIDMSPNEAQDQDEDKKMINGSSQSQEYPSTSNVILVHYHKTGNAYLGGLTKQLTKTLKGRGYFRFVPDAKHKRTHLQSTKCPDNLNKSFGSDSNVMTVIAPDLYCNEDDLELYMKGIDRVVHMVRDPIDMSISNYLYHSQYPTPEGWVKSLSNPCEYNQDMFDFVLPRAGIEMEEMNSVITMCKSYFYGNETNPGYPKKSFYDLLRTLPKYDGLRLATANMLLGASVHGGSSDLLRMSSNFVRYEQWTQKEDTSVRHSNRHLLNIFMQDLQQSMKNTTLKITNFIMADREKDEKTRMDISNAVASELERIYIQKETKGSKHVTNQILSEEQRMNFANRLEDDEIFGSVYSKIRSMMQD